jgi:lipopolysaccharide transport system permease protein
MFGLIRDIWHYRGFVEGSIRREIAMQYRGSLLGAAWVLIGPAALILIYTLVFSHVMRSRLAGVESAFAYSIFLCAGLLPWTFFTESVTRLLNVFVANSNLMKKAMFPRICLPVIALGTAAFNFAVIGSLFLLFLLVAGEFPGVVLVAAAVPALAVQIALATGLGMLFATLNVFFRDVAQAVTLALQFWFWLTPIVYPIGSLPQWAQPLLAWNPMAVLVGHYQAAFLYRRLPDAGAWLGLAAVAVLALLSLWLGLAIYRRRVAELVDEL